MIILLYAKHHTQYIFYFLLLFKGNKVSVSKLRSKADFFLVL